MNLQNIITRQALQNNPNIQKVMQLVGDRDPKEVFIEECKKRNIDPSTILNMIK